MKTEFEERYALNNEDKEDFRNQLESIDFKLTSAEKILKRNVYFLSKEDFGDKFPDRFVRLRDEGDNITIVYKDRHSKKIDGMKEVEFKIDDFEKGAEFLSSIGLFQYASQETKREVWEKDNVVVSIDTWPGLPPYTEIEGVNEKDV